MKNKKLFTALFIAVLVLLIAAEALTAGIILRLGMLPDKYVVILVIVLVLLAAVVGLLLFLPGKNKKVGKVRRIIACVLALVMICGCAMISKLASDAYAAIHAVTSPTQTVNLRYMYVLVRTDDPAQTLEDAAEYSFGVIEGYNYEQTMSTLAEMEKTMGKAPDLVNYTTSVAVADALLGSDVDATILNGISITLLMDEEKYEDFFERVRILETIPYEPQQVETTETTVPEVADITNTPFVLYLSGSDTRSQVLNISRSDVNILMVVNPVSKQILLVNTPRDYFVPNPAADGALDKLTHCGLYGVDCSAEALEDLYGVDVGYYGQINFTGFEKMVDAVGGITVYSDQSFTAGGGVYIEKGENYLNGEEALSFARERYHVSGGDNGRGKNQMKVITAIVDKATSGTTIISNYSSILDSLSGMFTTNVTMEEISKLVKMQLDDMASWNIQSYAVTGTGGYDKPYSQYGLTSYVMYPNEETVEHASQLMQKVINGDTLTDEDVNP